MQISAELPEIDRDPYERIDVWTEEAFSAPRVTVEAHNALYEDPDFHERTAPLMPAHIDKSSRSVFTTGLSFSRPPPGGKTTERLLGIAAEYARREFGTSLAEDGLIGVTDAGSMELRLRGRRTAKTFGFDADYPLAAGAGTGTDSLPVRVWAAIWPTADAFAMAGGVYPLESLSVAEVDDATVQAWPGEDRREVFEAIRAAAD